MQAYYEVLSLKKCYGAAVNKYVVRMYTPDNQKMRRKMPTC